MTRKEVRTLDVLWAKSIKERDKVCQKCSKSGKYLQAHHIWGRKNRATRWLKDNGILLCSGCHMLDLHSAHQDPIEFCEFIEKRLGIVKYNALKELAHQTAKYQNFDEIKKSLEN